MTMPNFFVIGAQKSGTTSLYHYLNQHPQVYMSPVKEPFFFDHEIDAAGKVIQEKFGDPGNRHACAFSDIEEYRTLFQGVEDEIAIGEASPLYIYAPGTAERIKRYVPEAKIIAILRNPADRAYSSFLHAVRIGIEPLTDFAQALQEEEYRIRSNWHYVYHYRNRGLYHDQLKPYYQLFGKDKVGVWLYEDLRDDPAGTMRNVFSFLGVSDSFAPDTSSKHNPAGVPKSEAARTSLRVLDMVVGPLKRLVSPTSNLYPLASKMRRRIQSQVFVKPPLIDSEIRSRLIEEYREDILKLQEYIERDLSAWLKQGPQDQPILPKQFDHRATRQAHQ